MLLGGDIPAPTGEPSWRGSRRRRTSGHPRTYGGTLRSTKLPVSLCGTSPHLRGNRFNRGRRTRARGDIPAPTGEPCAVRNCPSLSAGHPRTYGGTSLGPNDVCPSQGTSPHLRGNRQVEQDDLGTYRDIPAPTGEPPRRSSAAPRRGGHPRTYGGTQFSSVPQRSADGTSPHLRGNRPRPRLSSAPRRDIPAPTGEPTPPRMESAAMEGHPRTYGETPTFAVGIRWWKGTSPHLRGNRTRRRR